MKLRRVVPAVLCLAALSLIAPRASAQTKPDADVATAAQADALFRKGNELYKKENYREAKQLYEQAFALKRSHDIAANLGYAEMKLGLHRDAAEHLAFAVRTWPPTANEDKRKYAVERLEAEKKEVAALRVRIAPPGAAVFVDDRRVGTAPLEDAVFVEPGAHVIRATLAGHVDAMKPIQAARGREDEVVLELAAGLAAPSSSVAAIPHGPPGTSPEPVRAGPPTPLIVASGVAAGVALVGGVVFTFVANGKSSDATTLGAGLSPNACANPSPSGAGSCGALKQALSDQDTFANLARVGFIAGGVLAATTAGLVVWRVSARNNDKATARAAIVPLVSESARGVVVIGSF